MSKKIKNKKEFLRVINTVPGMSSRLLLHFLLTYKYKEPFRCTLYQMGHEGGVKNAQRAIASLLEKGYVTRELVKQNIYEYTLHIDLIEHL